MANNINDPWHTPSEEDGVVGPYNPLGSSHEKIERTERLLVESEVLESFLRGEGVDADLARRLSKAFDGYNNYETEKVRKLVTQHEGWMNRHNHNGTVDEDGNWFPPGSGPGGGLDGPSIVIGAWLAATYEDTTPYQEGKAVRDGSIEDIYSSDLPFTAAPVAWKPGGSHIAFGWLGSEAPGFIVIDVATGLEDPTWTDNAGSMGAASRALCWAPDGSYLAINNSAASTPYIVNSETKSVTQWDSGLGPTTNSMAISPGGDRLASAGNASPNGLVVYLTNSGIPESGWENSGTSVAGVAWSPDGTRLALGGIASPYIFIYDVATKSIESGWPTADGAVIGVAWSPNGEKLAITYNKSGTPFYDVIDVGTKTIETGWPAIAGRGRGVCFSHDSSRLAISHLLSPRLTVIKTGTKTVEPGWPTLPDDPNTYSKVAFGYDSGTIRG